MRIALLEDDPDQVALVAHWLAEAGHDCVHQPTGDDFLRVVLRESFDMLLIDWLVPGPSGIEVVRRFRDSRRDYTPVMFTTARDDEQNIVEALEAGADDYMIKPLRKSELLARVSALARRARGGKGEEELPDTMPYEVDVQDERVLLDGEAITLTHREFELALFMFRNMGRVVSRSHLLESIWGMHAPGVNTRTVDTHMSRLRKKMRIGADTGWQLSAIYQHGYRLERLRQEAPEAAAD